MWVDRDNDDIANRLLQLRNHVMHLKHKNVRLHYILVSSSFPG